jgi:hypothetical protein
MLSGDNNPATQPDQTAEAGGGHQPNQALTASFSS